MRESLISIIVPAYNVEKYIERCLDSILNQTYKNIEIIVVNDGSVDATAEIIDDIAKCDCRVKVIHKENGGVSSARIEGIHKASGAYIGFVDGDDFVEPEMFEHLLKNALVYKADISHCGYRMVFPDGHVDLYYGTGKLVEQTKESGIKDLIEGAFVEPGLWNKLFKRSIVDGFEKSILWDSSIKINEDLLMNYLLFSKAEKSVYEDMPFYHYILRKGSAATSKKQRYKVSDPIKVMKLIKNDVQGKDELVNVAYVRYLRTLISAAVQCEWKNEAKLAREELKRAITSKDLFCYCQSIKIRFMVLGVAYAFPIYLLTRKIYDLCTGIGKNTV